MPEYRKNRAILNALREETGLSKDECKEVYEALFFKILPDMLSSRQRIAISGFGVLKLVWYDEKRKIPAPINSPTLNARVRYVAHPDLRKKLIERSKNGNRK